MSRPVGTILYDLAFERGLGILRRRLLALLPPPEAGTVVDLACGTGRQLLLYQRRGCRVAGVDLSASMVESSRYLLGPEAEVVCGDARTAPLSVRSADLVLLSMALHEMPPDIRGSVLERAGRLLSPAGRLLVIDYHAGRPDSQGWPLRWLLHFVERLAGGSHYDGYRHFMAHGGVPALAGQHGLSVERRELAGGGNLGIFILRRPVPAL